MKKFLLSILLVALLSYLYLSVAFAVEAEPLPAVNILTWWGYLELPSVIKEIEKTCHVRIFHDEYYSNPEFIRRFNIDEQRHDIVIFSESLYNYVSENIRPYPSTLSKRAEHYHPLIKKHYLESAYPPNVVYFLLGITGVLSNPHTMNVEQGDSVSSLFHKAKNHIVIMMDDAEEGKMLFELAAMQQGKHLAFTVENFKKIMQDVELYITNDYEQIYKDPKFAMAFTWSGSALSRGFSFNRPYRFTLQPNISYITSDLLATLNSKPATACVADLLTSKKISSLLQNHTLYLSPYLNSADLINENLKFLYKEFLPQLPYLLWLTPPSRLEIEKNETTWEFIKINLSH